MSSAVTLVTMVRMVTRETASILGSGGSELQPGTMGHCDLSLLSPGALLKLLFYHRVIYFVLLQHGGRSAGNSVGSPKLVLKASPFKKMCILVCMLPESQL